MRLLILRPQPGADETAERAIAKRLQPVIAPIFEIRPLDWDAPDPAGLEAIILTSANAARHAGPQLQAYTGLPCYAVGRATAATARSAGFGDIREGPSGSVAIIDMLAADGIVCALHLCGRDHIAVAHPRIAITRRPVYASDAAGALSDEAVSTLQGDGLALIHSPRAGRLFGSLVDAAGVARERVSIAAISEAAAAAAGYGWKSKGISARPRDDALLELATTMCKTGSNGTGRLG